jgi:hypothetical protein
MRIVVAGNGYDSCNLHLVQVLVSRSEAGGKCLRRGIAPVDMDSASYVE